MSYLTRDLMSFAISRSAGEQITLVTKQFSANGDGSFTPISTRTQVLAHLVDLTPTQIKRLQDRGISLNSGINVSIVGEVKKAPDQIITTQGIIYKIVEFTINENVSVFICDLPPLAAAK